MENNDNVHEPLDPEELNSTSDNDLFNDAPEEEPTPEPTPETAPEQEETTTEEIVAEEEPTEPIEEEPVIEETTEDVIKGLKTDLTEKEIQRRILQSERDTYKELISQQPEAPKETLPKYKTVPTENLSPQDFMQEEYFPDEAGTPGTASHKAMQEYHREVASRSYAEEAQREKAKTADDQFAAKYNEFKQSVGGDETKLAVVDEAARVLSSQGDPNQFIGYDRLYQIGLLLRGELPDKTRETVQKITDHKAKLKEQPPSPFTKPNQGEEELIHQKELAAEEDKELIEDLGHEAGSFLDDAVFKTK